MHRGLSYDDVIDISIDVQVYINHVRLTKELGFPYPDKPFNATKYDICFIKEIESYAKGDICSFQDNWYSLIESISNNEEISIQRRIFALESIANGASKLILA